jgi:hypothetical protein
MHVRFDIVRFYGIQCILYITDSGRQFFVSLAIELIRAGGEFDKKCNVTKKTNRHFVWRNLLNF